MASILLCGAAKPALPRRIVFTGDAVNTGSGVVHELAVRI